MTTIDRVKKVIDYTVGADRLAKVRSTDLLVQGGIISSLEIVAIGLGLEQEFKVPIPDNQLTVANFATLETLAALMDQLSGNGTNLIQTVHEGGLYKATQDNLAGCLRHPIILALTIFAWLFLFDRFLLPYVVERGPLSGMYRSFSDNGRRLYQSSGGWAPDDLKFAVQRHEFTRTTVQAKPTILFFGDSGTIGSWVKADVAPPAQVEARLRQSIPEARVYNFAFFMRSFIKDVMLLEAILEANEKSPAFDTVIFTLSDGYFDAAFQKSLINAMPYFSFSRDLLRRFQKRIAPPDSVPYEHLQESLSSANRKFRGRFQEYVLERTSLYQYKSFFTFLQLYGKDPAAYWVKEYAIGDKPLFPVRLASPPADFQLHDAGFSDETLDRDMVALTNDVLNYLQSKNIKVFIFLRPFAPLEWQSHPFIVRPKNIETLIREQGWDKKATVIDLRWSLYGNQFSDTLSHYTPEGSEILGKQIGDAISADLKVTTKEPPKSLP